MASPADDCSICPRRCETVDEHLVDFKINNWGVYKNIKNQFTETKFVFHGDWAALIRNNLTGVVAPVTKKYVSQSLKKDDLLDCSGSSPCRGKFITADFRLWTDWKEDEIGNPYAIDWAEVDGGKTTTSISLPLTVGFKVKGVPLTAGTTVGISRTGSDIVTLGNQSVFFCDPILMPNNTGSITFRCD